MPPEPYRIGVNDLHQARAARAWAAYAHRRVVLHALDAPCLGMGYWRAVEQALGRPLVVECGTTAGAVLEALRAGLRRLRFEVASAQAPALHALVHAHGGEPVEARAHVRLRPGAAATAQLARWLLEGAHEEVTALDLPDKTPPTASTPMTRGRVECD